MSDEAGFAAVYYDEVRRGFRGHKRLADGALAQLDDSAFFHAPDPESNSAAVIVKHLAGNLRSRWTDFLTTDGEKPDRNRDDEFITEPSLARQDLLRRWEESFQIVFDTIASLTAEDINRTLTIRGEVHTVMQAMNRSVLHAAYHAGQIVYVAKHLRGAEWKTLSIARGKSAEFNATRPEDRKVRPPNRS
jgi:Protein of unknown function (DUF1572)